MTKCILKATSMTITAVHPEVLIAFIEISGCLPWSGAVAAQDRLGFSQDAHVLQKPMIAQLNLEAWKVSSLR